MLKNQRLGKNTRRKLEARQKWVKATELAATTDMTWAEIARECGYAGPPSVWRAVWSLLNEQADEARDKYRALEDARLEQAYDLVLAQIDKGNLGAVDRLVKLGERRAKLRGLNEPDRAPVNEKGETVGEDPYTIITRRLDSLAAAGAAASRPGRSDPGTGGADQS